MILSTMTLIVDGTLLVLPPPILVAGETLVVFRCPKGHVFLPSSMVGANRTAPNSELFANPVPLPPRVPCWVCRRGA